MIIIKKNSAFFTKSYQFWIIDNFSLLLVQIYFRKYIIKYI